MAVLLLPEPRFHLEPYQLPELRQLEKTIRSSVLAPYLVPGRTIHSAKPVLYDFMHSDYDHFEDYLSSLMRRD